MSDDQTNLSRGLQMSETLTWFETGPDGEWPEPGTWVAVWRNGGPRDGARMGTAWVTDDGHGFDVHLFIDENGERL